MHARYDRVSLTAVFNTLCVRVAEDLDRKGYVGRTIGIKLRYADFSIMTRGKTLLNPTADPLTIRRAAGECLQRIPLKQRFRLLGVRVGGLIKSTETSRAERSEEHTSELQSLMRTSYAVFCLKKKHTILHN